MTAEPKAKQGHPPLFAIALIALATAFVAYGVASLTSAVRRHCRKAVITDQAIWLARYWQEGATVNELRRKILEEQKVAIPEGVWKDTHAEIAITGPIVGDTQIIIYQDKHIEWISRTR